ncbi:hypothetical protein CHS0354_007873 [Potamilus streckersoni]|uniref:Uncharacterized protein n=1 Tax=Potamilus streckersoni TaxID=2493646 RepID=A0AAE0W3A6_9BIVA|nr:hypothetical protein CHS0354_007873 [Potamilus streckersoni]
MTVVIDVLECFMTISVIGVLECSITLVIGVLEYSMTIVSSVYSICSKIITCARLKMNQILANKTSPNEFAKMLCLQIFCDIKSVYLKFLKLYLISTKVKKILTL